jgi:hypothetical protein
MGSHWVFIIQYNDSKNNKGVRYFKNVIIGCVYNVNGIPLRTITIMLHIAYCTFSS